MAKTHNPASRTSGQVTHECREVKPKSASGGNVVKNPKQAMALDLTKGGKPGAALNPSPAPGRVAPDRPVLPDIDTSVAGEEDPGAALDLTGVGAMGTQAVEAAASGDPGPRPRRPPRPSSR